MAITTCVKCGGHNFEVRVFEPIGGNFKQNMVQCSACGVPVGVLDFLNLGAQTNGLKTQLTSISEQLSELQHRVAGIEQILKRK